MDGVRLAKGQSLPSLPGNFRIDDSGANSEGHCDLRNAGIAGLTLSDSGSGSDQECHDDALSAKTGDDSDIEDLLLDLPPVPKQKPTLHR
uniref:Uncharacterized protein n=1 Tax=Tetraselmis chuii TaxID=63592 RepID=A0A7S1SYU1_9CHLO